MKKILFVVMLVAVFSFAAMAQDAKVPSLVANHNGAAGVHGNGSVTWGLPSTPKAILFYGGDTNTSDPNEQGFANGNTLLVPTTTTYGSVTAPKSGKISTSAVFFNQSPTISSGTVFDPATGTYDVRTGISSGNGGTDQTHGSGPQTAVLTGRIPFGAFMEYTTTVSFARPLTAHDGTTYEINESPQCTNSANGNCGSMQYFFSNTTQQTNGVNANAQPSGALWFNSAFFGFTWVNWCDPSLGQNSSQCAWGSWGLLK